MEIKGDLVGPMSHPVGARCPGTFTPTRSRSSGSLLSSLCAPRGAGGGAQVKVVPKAVLQNNNLSWKPSQLGFPPQRPSAGLRLITALQLPRPQPLQPPPPVIQQIFPRWG